MTTSIIYHYDDERYEVGEIATQRFDHIDRLTSFQRKVELLLRAASPTAEAIRSTSLYGWEELDIARRIFKLKQSKFLYRMEISEASIRHRGDVNVYSQAVDTIKAGQRCPTSPPATGEANRRPIGGAHLRRSKN